MNTPINLQSKFELFTEHWSPKVIAELNDYQFKLVKIEGQFTWHEHNKTDEVFLVIEGSMGIEFKDRTVALKKGEMIVFPSHTWHKVNKVTKGIRKALVGWVVGKQWK